MNYLLFGETDEAFPEIERLLGLFDLRLGEGDLLLESDLGLEDLRFGDSRFLREGGESALFLGVRDLLYRFSGVGESLLSEERLLGVGDLRFGERDRRFGEGECRLFVSDLLFGELERFRDRDLIKDFITSEISDCVQKNHNNTDTDLECLVFSLGVLERRDRSLGEDER